MIRLVNSLVISNIILNLLLNDDRFDKYQGYIELFDNCREQGYKILIHTLEEDLTICFSRNRNSDNLVVYFINRYDRSPYKQEFWESKKLFDFNAYQEVVDYIFEIIKNEITL